MSLPAIFFHVIRRTRNFSDLCIPTPSKTAQTPCDTSNGPLAMSFVLDHFPDAAPRYPDRVAVQVPRGTRAALKRAAEAEHVTVPELVRRTILQAIAPDLLPREVANHG